MGSWLYFVAVCLTWGSSFLFMKLSLQSFNVVQVAFGRNFLGALALLAVLLVMRRKISVGRRQVGHTAVVALFFNVIPALLYAWAQTGISSGLASIYNATTPMMTLIVTALAFRSQRPGRNQNLGILIGLLGVLVIAIPEIGFGGSVLMHVACLGATACYGVGYVYLRHFLSRPDADPVQQTALQLCIASVVLAPLLAFAPLPADLGSPVAWFGIAMLGVVGTGLCYVWNNRLISLWGASRAAMTTYVTPAVGVLLGVLVLSEPLAWNLFVGLAIVLGSIMLSSRPSKQTPLVPEPTKQTVPDAVLENS